MNLLADLDELVIRCRSDHAKEYFAEAVACYKVGAYRACIVATWIAVVFDILHKFSELDLTGDLQARAKLQEFEQIRSSHDLTGSLKFEKGILDLAKNQFELLSQIEYADLQRLAEDRHRCAHPSMMSQDETYKPSSELARMHLRNAAIYLLQQPPVQGKAALDRLEKDVSSSHFPTNTADACVAFSNGPLSRPRDALVRNFTIILIKQILSETLTERERCQHAAALNAVLTMHRDIAERVLATKLTQIVSQIDDANLLHVVFLLQALPDAWSYLDSAAKSKIERYVSSLPSDELTDGFPYIVTIPHLSSHLLLRLGKASEGELKQLVDFHPSSFLVEPVLRLYAAADDWSVAANRRKGLVMLLADYFESDNIEEIVKILSTNRSVKEEYNVRALLRLLLNSGRIDNIGLSDLLKRYGLENDFSDFIVKPQVSQPTAVDSESSESSS